MGIADEKYISLTTFKRDGTAVATPVWVVDLDDDGVGFYTSSTSGKAKRLRHTNRVTVQPSDVRGRVKEGTSPRDATARLVTGPELEAIAAKVKAKYGVMTTVAKAVERLRHPIHPEPYADVGAVIAVVEPSS